MRILQVTLMMILSEHFKKPSRISGGGGYWVWKPYIILDALSDLREGDYLIYTDAGTAYVDRVQYLIDAMESSAQDVMCYALTYPERQYTKRDAFILMGCDESLFFETPQRLSGYVLVKKTPYSERLIHTWLSWMRNFHIISDEPSTLGDNYSGFIENRHDQTVWSLLTKREGLVAFRDPNCGVEGNAQYSKEIAERSSYPRVVFSHRIPYARYEWQIHSKWFVGWRNLKGSFRAKARNLLPRKAVDIYYKVKNSRNLREYE